MRKIIIFVLIVIAASVTYVHTISYMNNVISFSKSEVTK